MNPWPDDPQREPLTEYSPHSITGEKLAEKLVDECDDDYAEGRYTSWLMGDA